MVRFHLPLSVTRILISYSLQFILWQKLTLLKRANMHRVNGKLITFTDYDIAVINLVDYYFFGFGFCYILWLLEIFPYPVKLYT